MSWPVAVLLSTVFAVVVVVLFSRRSPKDLAGIDIALANGAALVDVRSSTEFAGGHLKGAINIPVQSLGSRLGELGARDKPIVLYCASGMRSLKAQGILRGAGFEQVLDLGSMSNGSGLSALG